MKITPQIKEHLLKDDVLAPLVKQISLPDLDEGNDLYSDLIRSIISQQLSVKAAETIYRRFLALYSRGYPRPKAVLDMDAERMRQSGLSRQKTAYVKNVARFFLEEKPKPGRWSDMDDEEIIEYLTQIKGVGTWTAQMILMFSLNRPDIFPVGDLGIRQSMIELYELSGDRKDVRQQLHDIAENWRPYRSVACRYLWAWK
ncbi:MAG: DNA-3-methyladenine glycosylase [Saprospiraceae bacterium]|nr:DNA-3-methyladenine glycosylase [Saprospiraceae bacterium]